jgi:hypothetical protein
MKATHLHCLHCAAARPIRFEPLLPGESSLGTCVSCAHCGRHAFTLLAAARFYCEICDEVRSGVLERVELEDPQVLGVLLVCAGCFDGKAMIYAPAIGSASATPASATPGRCAGAAASGPPAPGFRADRARRG